MSWIITGTQRLDPDAAIYIDRVEAADGQSLEEGVKLAYSTFVSGCKTDGIWDAIKASCILAGARTLDGALVPLVGTAPTNYNFVSGDYDRETGLVGDGSTKRLDSGRDNAADPQDDRHIACYASSIADTLADNMNFIGTLDLNNIPGRSGLEWNIDAGGDGLKAYLSGDYSPNPNDSPTGALGFLGVSRSSSVNIVRRFRSATNTISTTSSSPSSGNFSIFARSRPDISSADTYSNARLAFYSIGESLDLAALDTRVTTLMSDLAAAIP